METLVIYFSQKGKTKEAAGRIAQLSGADLAEIKTHKSYRMSYRKTVFTALKEILLNERPELDMEIPDISAYDMILSILVDTFISKISLTMQPGPKIDSISGA